MTRARCPPVVQAGVPSDVEGDAASRPLEGDVSPSVAVPLPLAAGLLSVSASSQVDDVSDDEGSMGPSDTLIPADLALAMIGCLFVHYPPFGILPFRARLAHRINRFYYEE